MDTCARLEGLIAGSCGVAVLIIDKGLEVPYFDKLTSSVSILDHRVKLDGVLAMLRQQVLNGLIVKQFFLTQAQNLKCLLLGHEAAFDSQPFLSHLLTATIAKFLHVLLVALLLQVPSDLKQPFLLR